ncbi:hypothetical protein MTO96_004421 [Rhipicephalus appendiculatus]
MCFYAVRSARVPVVCKYAATRCRILEALQIDFGLRKHTNLNLRGRWLGRPPADVEVEALAGVLELDWPEPAEPTSLPLRDLAAVLRRGG